ncbi:glycosyltransferase [Sphingobacterium spiritivorum]|uniref:glycosyltransferase n=1 Tax=Sphingobacterium spiritivorum TaxID=258 RepID=UPI003DA47854
MKKTIVISAVNLVEAGTLAILRDCLQYLSVLAESGEYKVVAVVHRRELADFPGIVYIETQWPKKRWINRIWYEYVSLRKISRQLAPVYLWLSLHDTSPNVIAERRAVYCHSPFAFYKWKWNELFWTPKIVLFALFTRYIYSLNIRKNRYVVVQQDWFRKAMQDLFGLHKRRVIVAPPPASKTLEQVTAKDCRVIFPKYSFIYAASPNSHKNFEVICRAVEELGTRYRHLDFKVYITVKGDENAYARWLYKNWGGRFDSLVFAGFLTKDILLDYYQKCDCLIFPSKAETWGLPVSEFAAFHKPMLLADLPYAYETAAGSEKTAFFDPQDYTRLSKYMYSLIHGESHFLKPLPKKNIEKPTAGSWESLFTILLSADENEMKESI